MPKKKSEEKVQGYCVRCKKKTVIKDPEVSMMSNGMDAAKGACAKCGTTVCKILGKSKDFDKVKKSKKKKAPKRKAKVVEKKTSKKRKTQSDEEKAAKRKARRLARKARKEKEAKKNKKKKKGGKK